MYLALAIFLGLIGFYGVLLSRKNAIILIMSIELVQLACILLLSFFSIQLDLLQMQSFIFYYVAYSTAQTSIFLSLLAAYHQSYNFNSE